MKNKVIIFLDIDGTLLDELYKPNSQRLPTLIKKRQKQGFEFGINSNRSLEDLAPIAESFRLNGPIIAENGCFEFTLKKQIPTLLANVNHIKPILDKILVQIARKNKAEIIWTDTVNFGKKEAIKCEIVYAVNKFRLYTASIHVWKNGVRSKKEADILAKKISAYPQITAKYNIEVTKSFFNIIITPKDVTKLTGLRAIKSRFPKTKFIGIGNGVEDLKLAVELDYFFTVENADKATKKGALYVSKFPYTLGVEDIVENIDKWL